MLECDLREGTSFLPTPPFLPLGTFNCLDVAHHTTVGHELAQS